MTKLLFGRDAELLLFVYNEKPQVLEANALANEFVRTYYNIYGSRFQALENLFRLLLSASPSEVFNLDGKVLEAARKSMEMLISEHSCRHKNGNLLVVDTSLESSSNRDLRLAKAYISANEPIHRPLPFHISLNILSGFQLVGRIFIEETCLEFVLHEAVVTE